MKFTVDNKTYIVKWEYPNVKDFYPRSTVCKIYDKNTSYQKPLIETIATCGRKEVFNKNMGRKISLNKALERLFPYNYKIVIIDSEADLQLTEKNLQHKKYRTIAWQEYFRESPKRRNA